MKISPVKNLSYTATNTEIKRAKKDFSNITFGDNTDKYSKTEGLIKGFGLGFLSFFAGMGLILTLIMLIGKVRLRLFIK